MPPYPEVKETKKMGLSNIYRGHGVSEPKTLVVVGFFFSSLLSDLVLTTSGHIELGKTGANW